MIGLDTNVMMRYLVQDDPKQSKQAEKLIEKRCNQESPGYIALIVLCELVWVMRRAYGYEKSMVVKVLDQLLTTAELVIQDEEIARKALEAYQAGQADYADYVLIFTNHYAGCPVTYSFDRKLAKHQYAALP